MGVAVPSHALSHPGHYYAEAARCATIRRDRFRAGDVASSQSPALAHERTVNHTEQIVELYTKAYELFKKANHTRQAVAVAHAIAVAYSEAGNHELALKFIERIAKTYRAELWWPLLSSLVLRTAEAAKAQGDAAAGVKAAIELLALAYGSSPVAANSNEAARPQASNAASGTPPPGSR